MSLMDWRVWRYFWTYRRFSTRVRVSLRVSPAISTSTNFRRRAVGARAARRLIGPCYLLVGGVPNSYQSGEGTPCFARALTVMSPSGGWLAVDMAGVRLDDHPSRS